MIVHPCFQQWHMWEVRMASVKGRLRSVCDNKTYVMWTQVDLDLQMKVYNWQNGPTN